MLPELVLPPAPTSASTLPRGDVTHAPPRTQHQAVSGSRVVGEAREAEAWPESLPRASTKAGVRAPHPHSGSSTRSRSKPEPPAISDACPQRQPAGTRARLTPLPGSTRPKLGADQCPEPLPSMENPLRGTGHRAGGQAERPPHGLHAALEHPVGSVPGRHPATAPGSRGGTRPWLCQPQTARQHQHLMSEQRETAIAARGAPVPAALPGPVPSSGSRDAWLRRGMGSGEQPPPRSQPRARGQRGAALPARLAPAPGRPWASRPRHCRCHR